MLHSRGGRSPIYKSNRKTALCTFSCASPTADQRCELIEREEKLKIACDRTIGIEGNEMTSYRYTPKKSSWAISWEDGHNLWALLPCVTCVGIISPLLASKSCDSSRD